MNVSGFVGCSGWWLEVLGWGVFWFGGVGIVGLGLSAIYVLGFFSFFCRIIDLVREVVLDRLKFCDFW